MPCDVSKVRSVYRARQCAKSNEVNRSMTKHATILRYLSLALVLAGARVALPADAPASLILVGGRIYTMNPAQPWADAMAVRGDRIASIGTKESVLLLKGPATRILDLQGGFLTPGLIDSHVHFFDGGRYLRNVALRDATTMAEVTRRVGQFATDHPQGDWIEGEGWSYGYPDMPNGEFHKEALDRASGRRPVFLDSSMAHAAWANSVADWIIPPGLTKPHLAALEAARTRYHDAFLTCCVAKFLMDGVIESHTAFLPGGYADKPSETGMRFFAPDDYKASVLTLYQHHLQVYTHAIGDGAIKLALDAYEDAQATDPNPPPGGPRNRIEHMEAPDPEDLPRFAKLRVIASMQPLMIYPRDEWKGMEGLWQQYAGERFLPTAFAIRSLLDTHAVVAFGTDWPVVQLNPLLGIRNAVLRQSLDGQPAGGYVPAQRISVAEALRAYTLDAAFASRAENQEGSIEVGKLADLVLFSKNLMEIPPNDIPTAEVMLTVVGGKIVYQR
jgi:predicted amidohydrolase YtcJ